MMRNIFKTVLLSSALTLTVSSCEMDQYPNDSISAETAWQSVDDAIKFRNGIYSYFKSINGGYFMYTADLQSDLFNATVSYSNRGGDMHRWDFEASQYDIEDIWQYNYVTINNCNNILSHIDAITGEDEEETATLNMIKGEAYLMRAICYHTLATRFTKDYEPASASSTLGLPLMTAPDPNSKPSRSTLAETYQLIKEDINNARTYLKTAGEANAIYFTVDVINALEARVDLYMHNYASAVNLAKGLIANYPLDADVDALSSMWLNDESSEVIYRTFQSVDERANSTGIYLQYSTATESFSPDFVPSQWVYDLYEDGDIRKEVFYRKDKITCLEVTTEDVYMLNKYPGNPALKKSEYEYYHMAKIFRSAEAYLIAAEASYMNNDETNALSYLNDLRTQRGASEVSASGATLLQEIKNEWIREFVGEGQRMNDLKRWHDGMQRSNPQQESLVMTGEGFTTLSKTADDMRMVWEIPNNDLNANSNLVGNWE
ncbi:MAG: RagB/SusD family nutrient uptake outer membrane protein [Bacteroidaceae bacterium]|nr:RagB/SusD family nutrient uptake outer membrane protein [Bacteroidaceae bacterium]